MAAQTQHSVTLVDLDQNILDKAEARIEASLRRVAKKGFKDDPAGGEEVVLKCLQNVKYATDPAPSLETADLLVEAVTEVLPLKQRLFQAWDSQCPSKTIFATNTSFLKVGDVMKVGRSQLSQFNYNPPPPPCRTLGGETGAGGFISSTLSLS